MKRRSSSLLILILLFSMILTFVSCASEEPSSALLEPDKYLNGTTYSSEGGYTYIYVSSKKEVNMIQVKLYDEVPEINFLDKLEQVTPYTYTSDVETSSYIISKFIIDGYTVEEFEHSNTYYIKLTKGDKSVRVYATTTSIGIYYV